VQYPYLVEGLQALVTAVIRFGSFR
jgi:hypothetical protein